MTVGNLTFLVLLSGLVAIASGEAQNDGRVKRQATTPSAEECMRPPMKRLAHECCRLPRERIWGDLKSSLKICMRRWNQNPNSMPQEMPPEEAASPDGSDSVTPTEASNGSDSTPGMNPPSTTPAHRGRGRPHWKNHHHHHHHRPHPNDSCFMECVFQDQGFISENVVNKEALIGRLNHTLGRNEVWHKVAIEAVETCHGMELDAAANSTCQSGAEEIFRCIFKQIFFNCPSWPHKSEYCSSLREFYQKCPNGPPPEVMDDHPTSIPDEMEDSPSTETETETERYTPE